MRVAFFTAGTTGAGHIVRGHAIARALARRGHADVLTLIGPPVELALAERCGFRATCIDHRELTDPARAPSSALARELHELAPDVLIVDLFWAPLARLLPLPGCETWLLLRRVPAPWFVGPPGLPYRRELFTRVIGIEPGAADDQVDETIDPIVVANPDERKPRGALRTRLGVAPHVRLEVVHQVGGPGEVDALARARPQAHVFTLARGREVRPPNVHDGDALFPLCEWLGDADALVSGGGYNAFWEAKWLGHHARTSFVPFARPLDDQSWRIERGRDVVPRANGADTLAARLTD